MIDRERPDPGARVAGARQAEMNGVASGGAKMPDATRARLGELSHLEADWDSYGALPVSARSLTMAARIIEQMVAQFEARGVPTDVMPIADGGVQMEWRGRTCELALNAAPDGSWSYLLIERKPEGRAYRERYGLDDAEAVELAVDFLSR